MILNDLLESRAGSRRYVFKISLHSDVQKEYEKEDATFVFQKGF